MIHKEIQSIKDVVSRELLPFVRRPGRYIGGEINQVVKDLSACDVRVALCFPDIYEIGMSYLGMEILYSIVNRLDGVVAERVFAPWFDAEEVIRKKNIPLFTTESRGRVRDFDLIGFSLTNELCYTNLLNMLDLAGLEVRSENRNEDDPIIIVGGQAANCAEPLSVFADMFVLGEGEEAAAEIIELYRRMKKDGASKEAFLLECAKQFSFVYVPRFYEFDDTGLKPKIAGLRAEFENAVIRDFENAPIPEKPIVPFVQTVHERVSIEIMRGCPGRCRFCQA
ncbi:MAG: radical SAM family protein, partial [Planctomycetota bacterium]